METLRLRINRQESLVDKLCKEIWGNGDSSNSIITRMVKVEQLLTFNTRLTWAILISIVTMAIKAFFFTT